ncbi:C-terminal processing protease CtpA/Prc [Dysgonomonadaceae bacterium PH5-43]|nr:C-terminal processing protease CtpA/Prc [Dysgonomonadaceae bacterium PH5-43]
MAKLILQGYGSTPTITIENNDKKEDITLSLYPIDELNSEHQTSLPNQDGYQILDNNIGYILPSSCSAENRDEGLKKIFNNTKGIIIDMRCYPGDYISFPFLRHLSILKLNHSLITAGDVSYPGYHYFINWEYNNQNFDYTNTYEHKIVVIVNEETQSQAEDNVLGFQLLPQTIAIGSPTAGANGAVSRIPLLGGLQTRITGLGVYYPDGSNLQRCGVKIDEFIEPTIEENRAERDEVLERAIEIIKN